MLSREPVDFALQVFTEAHCAGHHAWHLHDPAHPSHDPRLAAALGDPLKRVYAAIDAAIGAVIADFPASPVVVFAGHGMSHLHGAQFLLRDLLVRLGVTAPLALPRPSPRERAVALAGNVWLALPAPLRHALGPLKRRVWRDVPAPASSGLGVDAAASRCFPVSNGLAVGGIRLNLSERVVSTLDLAPSFCARLGAPMSGVDGCALAELAGAGASGAASHPDA